MLVNDGVTMQNDAVYSVAFPGDGSLPCLCHQGGHGRMMVANANRQGWTVAFSCQSRAARQRDIRRLQSVMDTACRYVFRTRLSRMKDQHSDLRALLHIERDIWLV